MAKKSYFAEHYTTLAQYALPASFHREIGRIVTRWAYFENGIQEMNWQAAGVSSAVGRIALREPRVTDRLEMLKDLIAEQKGVWDDVLFKSIVERARSLSSIRDMLAHGIWGHHPTTNEWSVQLSRGRWPKDLADYLISGSRKVTPEGVLMDPEKLRGYVQEIETLIEDLKTLRKSAHRP